jgi:hypothetical protein
VVQLGQRNLLELGGHAREEEAVLAGPCCRT